MFHNDPMWDGSHIADWCMYKPVFVGDELLFWTVSKGHMADSGGPGAGELQPGGARDLRRGPADPADQALRGGPRAERRAQPAAREHPHAPQPGGRPPRAARRRQRRGAAPAGARRQVRAATRSAPASRTCSTSPSSRCGERIAELAGRHVRGQPVRRGRRPRPRRPGNARRRIEVAGDTIRVTSTARRRSPSTPTPTGRTRRAPSTSGSSCSCSRRRPSTRACTARSRSTTGRPGRS